MRKVWIGTAAVAAIAALAMWLVSLPKAQAQGDRPARYACVIASMGKMVFYKGGFRSWTNCMAFCSYNANIRSWGGQLEIRYNCPPE